jgi:CheY-like chemotaxis protein
MVPSENPERFSVLAVDDNEAHCYAMQKILKGFGYNVTCAATGLSAVEQAKAGNFDAVLLDIHLPDINGFEVLAQIRNAKELNQPAVVFHSATSDTTSNLNRTSALDAEGFLTYPVEPEHIDTVIRGAIRRRRALNQKASKVR